MFSDWSEDVGRTYDDDETAGGVNRPQLELPSERHVALYRLLRSTSHRDQAGRLVSWWPQVKLAERLGVSVRTLRRVLDDLREPGLDPRHPRGRPPGLRLGVVRVEATSYRDQASGRHRLGGNLYVLVEHGQQATLAKPVSAPQVNRPEDAVACLNKSTTPSLETEDEYLGVTGVSSTEPPPAVPAVLEVGRQRPLRRLDYDPSRTEILAALEAGLGPVEVLAEWPNDQLPPRSVRRWLTKEEAAERRRRARIRGGGGVRG